MKTYCVTLAQDIPHYAFVVIEAKSDAAAIAKAKALDENEHIFTGDWTNPLSRRIVGIEDEQGRSIAHDIALDSSSCSIVRCSNEICGPDEARQLASATPTTTKTAGFVG